MSDIAELKHLVKSLQQASSDKVRSYRSIRFDSSADYSLQEIVDVLQVLKKEAKITEAVLRVCHDWSMWCFHGAHSCPCSPYPSSQESKAGLAVGKLRSHAAKDVSELAKEIVRAWKTVVDKEKQAARTASKGAAKPATGTRIDFLLVFSSPPRVVSLLMEISVPELIRALSLIQLLPNANSPSRPARPRLRAHRTTAPARRRARAWARRSPATKRVTSA
jgi:hypothetical protein